MQRPWGPHTLEEMCHGPFRVSLGATATVQLSITAEGLWLFGFVRLAFVAASRCFTSALVGFAVVLPLRAGFPFVVVGAAAVEICRQAVAARRVPAGVGAARVLLDLREAGQRSEGRHQPSSALAAWGRHLAGGSTEARRTFADEAAQQGVAAPAVPTRSTGAAVPPQLAVPAHKPRRADALVSSGRVLKPTASHFTGWVRDLAGPPPEFSESHLAASSVLALTVAAVHACKGKPTTSAADPATP